jgi:DNA-binding IclR family transcriptional regulator
MGPNDAAAILGYVRRNPGATCQQIAAGTAIRPAIVSVELKSLRAAGKLESQGNTRGTRWRVAGLPAKRTTP